MLRKPLGHIHRSTKALTRWGIWSVQKGVGWALYVVKNFHGEVRELPRSIQALLYTWAAVSLIIPLPGTTVAIVISAKYITKKYKNRTQHILQSHTSEKTDQKENP